MPDAARDLPPGYQFGDQGLAGVPCRWCIKMVAASCRARGCLHEQYRYGILGMGDLFEGDPILFPASRRPREFALRVTAWGPR